MKNLIIIFSLLSLMLIGCDSDYSGYWKYNSPENIGDGFEVGKLDDVKIDTHLIANAVGRINQGKYKEVHSMLIYKDNKLVFEEYYQGHKYKWDGRNHHGELVVWDRNMQHHSMSAAKSFTSACVGIAIDKGFIKSVHQSIFDYLPEHQHLNTNGKDKITIEHLLTMTSGLEWNEWGAPLSSKRNDLIGLFFQDKDPVTAILERPLVDEPGTDYTYSGANMILLGEIIRHATNMGFHEFSQKYLFEPLEFDSAEWVTGFENGVIYAGGGLIITPRDMLKFGVTYLNGGVWQGKQIVPEPWIEKSAVLYRDNHGINIPEEPSGRMGYSYSWWTKTYSEAGKEIHMFAASGWGGQHIMILPELNTVVVFTGGKYGWTGRAPFKILERFIIPALVSQHN